MDDVALLEDEVRELIRRRGINPLRDPAGLTALVSDAVADYDQRSLRGHVPPLVDAVAASKAVVDAVAGLGPLQRYLDDKVEEIEINSSHLGPYAGQRAAEEPQSACGPQ